MEIELVSASPEACHPTVRHCALCWVRCVAYDACCMLVCIVLTLVREHSSASLVRSRLSHSRGALYALAVACSLVGSAARHRFGIRPLQPSPTATATVRCACTRLRLRMQRGWPPRCGIARASVSRRTSSYGLLLREYWTVSHKSADDSSGSFKLASGDANCPGLSFKWAPRCCCRWRSDPGPNSPMMMPA